MNRAARIITSTYQEQTEQYGHPAYRDAVNVDGDSPDENCKFAVVPPGVNLRIFDAETHGPEDERITDYLERMFERDIEAKRRSLPAVLCSSRLDPKKNHISLVEAFAQSEDLRASANLLIVLRGVESLRNREGLGDTEREVLDEIVDVVEAHDLWGAISAFSLGSQQELAAAYRHLSQRQSVFALTALYEPFGLAPLEAIAAGMPAVVTRNGGPSESLYDANTGEEFAVLVDPVDPEEIAAGLLRLVGPDNEWEAFRDAGRERVLARYTWERTAEGYAAVVREIVSDLLPIPPYFWDPRPENDLTVAQLTAIWRPRRR
jgi:sucrose-phosphate synthase